VFEAVDSQGDDWIIKIDEQGDVVWQYISSASGEGRFNDVIELSDGSLILVGQDTNSEKAVALKLDAEGARVWEVLYRPDDISVKYEFLDVVEFNNQLYVASAEWGPNCGYWCKEGTDFYLHTLSISDGVVSGPQDLSSLLGKNITAVRELEVTSAGAFLITGIARPDSIDPDKSWEGGVYLQLLDVNLEQLMTWYSPKSGHYLGDVIELSNGKFAVITASGGGDFYDIRVVNSDGSVFAYNRIDDQEYWSGEVIVSGSDGKVHGFFQDRKGAKHPYTLMSFNSELSIEAQLYISDFTGYIFPQALVRNDDGSFTFLMRTSTGSNIVIAKRAVN